MDEPYTIRDLARWWEGEGSVQCRGTNVQMSGASTDLEVLEHFKAQFGGYVYPRKVTKPNHKPCWRWVIAGEEAMRLMRLVRPYVFSRRQGQIDAAFAIRKEQMNKVKYWHPERMNSKSGTTVLRLRRMMGMMDG